MFGRSATRLALISLLFSLVLSSGEGIRLLPIPDGTFATASSQSVSTSSTQRYQYAARWFSSPTKQSNSTNLKNKHEHVADAGPSLYADLEHSRSLTLLSDGFEWLGLHYRSGNQSLDRGRGPPFC